MPRPPRETPIERIFREILRQKMPLAIRDILLRKPIVQPKQSRLASSDVQAQYLNAGLHAAMIFDRFYPHMTNHDFAEIQRKLETITLELKIVNDPERRRTLLREMSRLVAEAERISGQPPK